MSSLHGNARMALAFGVGVPLLQVGRVLLWGHWPPLREVPIDADGYLAGAILVWGAVLVAREVAAGPFLVSAGWGIGCGILYRSLFEQLADPARHAGHEVLVMGVKGALLVLAALGLVGSLRGGGAVVRGVIPPMPSREGGAADPAASRTG